MLSRIRNPFLFLSFNPFCPQPLRLQRRNAWAHAFRTCSSPMICHHWRLWRCSLACPASSRTPVTCRRPCWTISECARVTPSSAISCSGTTSNLIPPVDMLLDHRVCCMNIRTSFSICVQTGTDQGGRIERCTQGPGQPRYLSDHIWGDGAETRRPHNWSPLPAAWLCSPSVFRERFVKLILGCHVSLLWRTWEFIYFDIHLPAAVNTHIKFFGWK